ncbi:hypothetical protein [Prauserella marina]|uniref:sunset domain-containing protein n=1 Tax=Prauserella marina TaxID=530584 RepID=UPI001FEBC529|nr:hypothetical protein [Prauserella marina]
MFSAIAFVLGAFLSWLFLVRPAQRRIRELERRLAASERSVPVEPGHGTRVFDRAGSADAEPVAPVVAAPSTRHFEPVEPEQAAAEQTQHIPPVTNWPERDSMQDAGGRHATPRVEESDWQDVAAVLDADDSMRGGPGAHAGLDADDEQETRAFSYYDEPRAYPADEPKIDQQLPDPEPVEPRHTEPEQAEYPEPAEHTEPEPVEQEQQPDPVTERLAFEPEPEPEPVAEPEPEQPPRKAPSLFEPVPFDFDDEDDEDYSRPESPRSEPETSPPAYAFGAQGAAPEPESPVEQTQVLPKRQPRSSPPGGFDPPKPIQPSMRPVARREPDQEGPTHSGSLFEPTVAPTGTGGPTAPPARDVDSSEGRLPPGPFGPGSAMPKPGGGRPSDDFAVKASVTALRYCTEESAQFPRMVAEVWFRTPSDAERVGFRPLS